MTPWIDHPGTSRDEWLQGVMRAVEAGQALTLKIWRTLTDGERVAVSYAEGVEPFGVVVEGGAS